ncbi:hypothetical protein ACHAXS_005013 [Conticribra weissflogii]
MLVKIHLKEISGRNAKSRNTRFSLLPSAAVVPPPFTTPSSPFWFESKIDCIEETSTNLFNESSFNETETT